jgi:anaerobic magnesium-protoporphyrin IX monomethyl ester cyclase
MVDIILVNPPLTGEERYGSLAAGGVYMPPQGLANLAAFIRQKGYSVTIVDCCVLNLNQVGLAKHILSYDPRFVGITAVTISINKAADLAGLLKEQEPDLKIIVGGCHLSALPKETMSAFPQFDIGVIGEGELTIIELLRVLEEGKHLNNVKGIIFRENGTLKITPSGSFIEDLDTLPFPAWDLLPDITRFYRPSGFSFKRLPTTSLVTLRGCPMRCTFCSDGPFAKTVRLHSSKYVLEMIKFLQRTYKIKEIMFYDGTFVINRQRLIEICELMIKEKLDLVWSCNGRIDMMTQETLRLMKRAGCWLVGYGVESGSQQVLDFYRKDIELEKAYKVLRWTKQAGMFTKSSFMLGQLIENKETLKSTMNFILKSDLDLITVTYFTPLPGTLDYVRASQYGSFDNNWDLLNFHNIVFVPRGLNKDIIRFYRQCITSKFYLRPRIIFRHLVMLVNLHNFKIIILAFWAFLKMLFLDKNK